MSIDTIIFIDVIKSKFLSLNTLLSSCQGSVVYNIFNLLSFHIDVLFINFEIMSTLEILDYNKSYVCTFIFNRLFVFNNTFLIAGVDLVFLIIVLLKISIERVINLKKFLYI